MKYVGLPQPISASRWGGWVILRFSVQRRFCDAPRVYEARVIARAAPDDSQAVAMMHQVVQVAGGREIGGTIDHQISVSRNHKHRNALDAIAAHLAHTDEVAAMLAARERS